APRVARLVELALDRLDQLLVQRDQAFDERESDLEVVPAVWQSGRAVVRLANACAHPLEVFTKRADALSHRGLADEIGREQPDQRLAPERRETHGRGRPLAQRREALLGEGVHGALARLAGLPACGEVPEPGESLRLDVVLALAGPREETASPRHAQQVVGARAAAADERQRLVGEQGEVVLG